MAAPRRYPDELRERAIRMAVDARRDPATRPGALARIGGQLGIPSATAGTLGRPVLSRCPAAGGHRSGSVTPTATLTAPADAPDTASARRRGGRRKNDGAPRPAGGAFGKGDDACQGPFHRG